jgi:hypothetical protein
MSSMVPRVYGLSSCRSAIIVLHQNDVLDTIVKESVFAILLLTMRGVSIFDSYPKNTSKRAAH